MVYTGLGGLARYINTNSFTIMGLQSSDLILVERTDGNTGIGTLYKETYGNRANIDSSDLIVIERADGNTGIGTKYKCTYSNFSSANSTDLILVERTDGNTGIGTLYKETKSNWTFGAYADIHSANYAVNPITTLYGQTGNNSNAYSVAEVQIEVSSSASYAAGDLYIGFRNTAGTAWQGDLPIAAIQILESDGTTVRETATQDCTWNFALGNTTAGYSGWGTSTATITNISTSPASATYYSIGTSATARRFSYTTSGTGSSYVGAARGISSSTYTGNPATTSILPVGSANVSQSSSSSDGYLFSECSGTSTNDVTWLSLETTGNIYNGDRIRICYFGGGNGQTSTSGLQTTNSLYLRFV